jgi:alcohol dehydrogenase
VTFTQRSAIVRTIRSVQVDAPAGDLHLTAGGVQEPGFAQVRIAVEACGVCRTDSEFVNDRLPGLSFPITPGPARIPDELTAVEAAPLAWRG